MLYFVLSTTKHNLKAAYRDKLNQKTKQSKANKQNWHVAKT